jgi:protein-tyrosine phosphatase
MNVDIHNHILEVFKKAESEDKTFLTYANEAVNNEITHIIATPNRFIDGKLKSREAEEVNYFIKKANDILMRERIPLTILPGCEVHLNASLLAALDYNKWIFTLNEAGKYALVHLPSDVYEPFYDHVLFQLIVKNITPIIAHPERYPFFIENPERIRKLINRGVLMQIDANSIVGLAGKKKKNFVKAMLDHHYVHFLSSNAWNSNNDKNSLKLAYLSISQKYGVSLSNYLKENAKKVVEGDEITIFEPKEWKKPSIISKLNPFS